MKRLTLPPYLPNLLSSARIALAPAMLGAAYSNSRIGFSVLLVVALLSDALDGPLARRAGSVSAIGQRLDRWGDGLTTISGSLGISFLWLEIVEREWHWILVAFVGYAMCGLQRLLEPAADGVRPSVWWRLCGWALPLSLVPLLTGWTPLPFQAAAVLQACAGGWKLSGVKPKPDDESQTAAKLEQERTELTEQTRELRPPGGQV